jgi:transposase InsO family protein
VASPRASRAASQSATTTDRNTCPDAFQNELEFLGIESSPAFVRAPEGNGCAERFIRTLKENLLWVQTFDTIEQLRRALLAFRETYNATWLIERHGFIAPAVFREKQLQTAALAA